MFVWKAIINLWTICPTAKGWAIDVCPWQEIKQKLKAVNIDCNLQHFDQRVPPLIKGARGDHSFLMRQIPPAPAALTPLNKGGITTSPTKHILSLREMGSASLYHKQCLFILLLFSLLFAHCGKEETPEPVAPEPELYSMATPTPLPEVPPITFENITKEAGIDFKHTAGYSGKKYMPETMGAGGGFFDYDNDGDLDLFLVNSRYFAPEDQNKPAATCALYENDGTGRFTDVTQQAGLDISLYGMGCTMADVDGDHDQDLFITAAIDGNRYFENNGDGTFTDHTNKVGLQSPQWKDEQGRTYNYWSTGAAFFDYDKDHDLDLVVCNYIEWSIENDIYTTRDGMGKSFTTPDLYQGQTCLLYQNQGDGTFEDVTQQAGLYNPEGKSLGIAIFDFNSNGYLDFAVSNDSQPNNLYVNQQDGAFVDKALTAGVAYDENGRARAGMGIDVARWNRETPAIAIGNFSHEPVSLYNMENTLFFVDAAGRARISRPSLLSLTFGLVFFDYNLDGYLDLALANGHIEPDIHKVEKEVKHAQPPQLFLNRGGKRFEEVTYRVGDGFAKPMVGRGLAYGDIDLDGDLDLLFTECNGPARLLRNENAALLNHHLRIKLIGNPPNTDAIGAEVRVTAGGTTQMQMVRTGSSYLSQSELALTFGLGDHEEIESLHITWPDGSEEEIEDLMEIELDKTNRIKQNESKNR